MNSDHLASEKKTDVPEQIRLGKNKTALSEGTLRAENVP
jgi:hypothetical protein